MKRWDKNNIKKSKTNNIKKKLLFKESNIARNVTIVY